MVDLLWIIVIFFLLLFSVWISSCFFGAPFQPSANKELKEMIKISKIKKGQKIADLGSGNGKIVTEFAKQGAEAHGYEINPILVWISRKRIKNMRLQNKAFIHSGNFMKANLSKFNIITSFQISYIMPELEAKLKKELKHGSKVISNTWQFPSWKPERKIGHVYLYQK